MALVAVACGGDGGGDDPMASGRAGTSTSTPADTTTTFVQTAAVTTTSAPGGTSSTTRGQGRAAAIPPPAPTTSAPAAVRALTPVAPGTYRYDTTGTTTFNNTPTVFPGVTALFVDPPAGSRQHSRRDLRDPAGNGPTTEFTVDYRPDGVYLEELKIANTVGGYTETRVLRAPRPLLLLPTGARPGHHLELELSVIGGSGGTARAVVDVVGEEPVAVGTATVATLVVRAVVELPPGDVTGRSELTVWVDRATSLFVREQSVGDAAAAGGLFRLRSEYRATLQRLTPG